MILLLWCQIFAAAVSATTLSARGAIPAATTPFVVVVGATIVRAGHAFAAHAMKTRGRGRGGGRLVSTALGLPWSRSFAATALPSPPRTRYTIDCPPTPAEALEALVERRCRHWREYDRRKPIADHTRRAFDEVYPRLASAQSLVLDSGCGTGRSTRILSRRYPGSLVVGVDRSAVRLSRSEGKAPLRSNSGVQGEGGGKAASLGNMVLVRADLADFWSLMWRNNLAVDRHYLLYPNPYPKRSRLNLRWYGHAAFPLLSRLHSRSLVVRSNWLAYLDEFAAAAAIAYRHAAPALPPPGRNLGSADSRVGAAASPLMTIHGPVPVEAWQELESGEPLTPFEAKYRAAGEVCYELVIERRQSETG
jgi:SAM-dependent methyltransferase